MYMYLHSISHCLAVIHLSVMSCCVALHVDHVRVLGCGRSAVFLILESAKLY